MSWREYIDPELAGSFRDAAFYVTSSKTTVGRRWAETERPDKDGTACEDKGRIGKTWELTLLVAGEDYHVQRDKLVAALDEPGPGDLKHPFLGKKSAVVTAATFEESSSLGLCTFQVTFKEPSEPPTLDKSLDTRRELGEAATAVEQAVQKIFTGQWNLKGLTDGPLSKLEHTLASEIDDLEQVVGGITDKISEVIRTPANMVSLVLGGYNRIRNAVMRPLRALDLYSSNSVLSLGGADRLRMAVGTPARAVRMLHEAITNGSQVTVPPADTPQNTQMAGNILAASQLNGRLAAVTAARVIAETDWLSRQDAEAAGRDALALIDHQLKTAEPISDEVYNALTALRAALSTDLRTRVLALPNLTEYTPQTTLPALVIAHRLYGDATRADEICVRNKAHHPGALRGGMALEVLSE